MTQKSLTALVALPLVAALSLASAPAHAQWRGPGWGGGYYHRGPGPGAIVGGALLGLGVGALLAAPYYAPPPVVYAPPARYYAPPVRYYYPPPAYGYAPPPGYYPAPGYYGR